MKVKIALSVALTAAVTLALVAGTAHAQQADPQQGLDYSLRAGLGYSDNLGRSSGGSSESAFYSIGGTLDWHRDDGRVRGSATADLDWMDYFESGFDSQVWGNLNADVQYQLVQDRLLWVFENNFGQGVSDPFASSSPNNSENINFFSTGPDLTFRFGSAMGATLGARYANAWYQDTPNDNNRYSGDLQLFRELSAQSRIYLRGSYEDVQYQDLGYLRDYDRTDGALGYTVTGARTSLDFEGGYSQLNFATGDSDDGPLFRLTVTRDLSASLQGLLRAGYEYNDAAQSLQSQGFLTNPEGTTTISAVGGVYQDKYVGGELRYTRHRTGLRVGAEYHDQDYVRTDQFDSETFRVFAGFNRQLSTAMSVRADVNWDSTDFVTTVSADYDEWNAALGLVWQATRTVGLDLGYQYSSRSDDLFGGYDENRLWLRAQWSPGAVAAATPEL